MQQVVVQGVSIDPTSQPAHWLVVNTHPHRELYAVENLERQGFEAYCPMGLRRVVRRNRSRDEVSALFRSYVFVSTRSVTHRWAPIVSTYGVRSVVRRGIQLALLGDEFVTALRAREVDGVVRKPVNPFSVGQQISVRGGPLDGMVGEILELRDKDRVFVLLSLLNSEVKAQFRCDQIAAAGV